LRSSSQNMQKTRRLSRSYAKHPKGCQHTADLCT
jgi:hypothetical protein